MSDEHLQRLAVIVVNFGPSDLLEANLVQVAKELAPATVVVVDNLSTPRARGDVAGLCARNGWVGVYPDGNTGFGGGCNQGAARAMELGAERLLFLNPDARIDRRSVEELLTSASTRPNAILAPVVVTADGAMWSAGVDLNLDNGTMRSWRRRSEGPIASSLPWVSGACLLTTADFWSRIGGFDEDYFLYWEDVDLCARALAAGGQVDVVTAARAVHDEGRTHTEGSSGRAKSTTYYYYNIRNRQLFASKHLSAPQQRRWLRGSLAAAREVLLRGGKRQFRHPVAPLTAAWRGLRDGANIARAAGGATHVPDSRVR